jgi:glycosyltransferase involved in cell wall biosynthesis
MSKTSKLLIIGIDASRNRGGGAKSHLLGILNEVSPLEQGIEKVHIWAYRSLLDAMPDYHWLVKHHPNELEQSLLSQIWWQATKLTNEAKIVGCDILLATDASTFCRFKPMVVMSRDMLSYEPGAMRYFGYGSARLRLLTILILQNLAFRFSEGVIFLTRYAGKVIQESCGQIKEIAYIPHGIGQNFKKVNLMNSWPLDRSRPINCIYVSPVFGYKHHCEVVRAIESLREIGYAITLTLIGGGSGPAQRKLDEQMKQSNSKGEFVIQLDFIPQNELPEHLANSDIFIFAPSCENMPNTLLEAMAVGLPIACSNRGPMPEVLQDGGIYFDPEDAKSISNTVEKLITEDETRNYVARRARELANQYSWVRCSNETFSFLRQIYYKFKT